MSTKKNTPVVGASAVTSRALKAAYSHYGNTAYVASGDGKTSSQAVSRVFAAALLSSASFVAVGAATSTSALAACSPGSPTTGQTVICSGTITDSQEFAVDDLTVVVNGLATINTTGNPSAAPGDNVGLAVFSESGDATITNNGGVYSGYSSTEGPGDANDHHGIVGYTTTGTATVTNTGYITTDSFYSNGAYAHSEDGDAYGYNSGRIQVNEDGSIGLAAAVTGGEASDGYATAINQATGKIYTNADYSTGVSAHTSGDTSVTATAKNYGLIDIAGSEYSTGISADGYDALAQNFATIDMGSNSFEADDAVAVEALSSYDESATALNGEDGVITIYGDDATGVLARDGLATATNDGSITIYGDRADVVVASSESDSSYATNNGTIDVEGDYATGVFAAGFYANASNSVDGDIRLYGDAAHAVVTDGFTTVANNDGFIGIYGQADISYFDLGSWFSRSAPNLGGADNEGYRGADYMALGVAAFGYSGATATNGEDGVINISGFGAVGLSATTEDGVASATNYGSITVGSIEGGAGIDMGVLAFSEDGAATAKNFGSVTTYGDYSSGVLASSVTEDATAVNYVGGSITTKDFDGSSNAAAGVAAFSTSGDAAAINGASVSSEEVLPNDVATADITTYGALAFGVAANSVYGHAYATNTEDGVIVTHGDLAIGVLASSMSDRNSRAQNDGSITTYGAGAAGVAALGGGLGVTPSTPYGVASAILDPNNILGLADVPKVSENMYAINNGTIHTSGLQAFGVYAAASVGNAHAGNSGSIYTTEDQALGVVAASITGGARAINYSGGYIHTDGDQATGVFAISGNSAYGYVTDAVAEDGDGAWAVNGSNFSVKASEDVARAEIVTTGDNAVGVNAVSYGSTASAYNKYSDITTGVADVSGFKAHGLYAVSHSGGDATAANKYYSEITTNGDEASGVKALALDVGDDAQAINWKYSNVETFGDGAHGVAAISEGGDATAFNFYASDVVTHGAGSVGVLAYATEDALAKNTSYSSITTYGDNAGGLVAYSISGEATAVNGVSPYSGEDGASTIVTFGYNSDGLLAITEDGNAIAGNVSGSSITTHGEDSFGMAAVAHNGYANVINGENVESEEGFASDGSSITTYGIGAAGIYALSTGFAGLSEDHNVTVKNYGDITTHGSYADGIYAASEDGSVIVLNDTYATINTGSTVLLDGPILNDGFRAFGIAAYSGNEDILINNRGSITTNSEEGVGIYAEANGYGNVTVYNSGSITTNGDGTDYENTSSGIFANAQEGGDVLIVNEDGGSITTYGDYAYGIMAYGEGADVTVNNFGSISTSGYESGGMYAYNDSGDINMTNGGTIGTTGVDSIGIWARSDGIGDISITNTEDGIITTSGAGKSHGIYGQAEFDGDVRVVNNGSVTVTGEDAIGIKANGDYAVEVYNTGSVSSTYGNGIWAYSGYGESDGHTYVYNSGSVTGDVYAGAYNESDFVNHGGTVTGAVFLFSEDSTVSALISGTGNDITKGLHAESSGDAGLSFEQTDTMTFADGVEGYALSGWTNTDFVSGTTIFDNGGTSNTVDIDSNNIAIGGVPAESGTYVATVQFSGGNDSSTYVDASQTDVKYNGTMSVDAGTTVNFSGDVIFEGGSFGEDGNATFRTQLNENGVGRITGNTIRFENNSNIYVDVTGTFDGVLNENNELLIASASGNEGYGVEDFGAAVSDNTILWNFEKVISEDGVHTTFDNTGDDELIAGSDLYLLAQVDQTAFDLSSEDGGTTNENSLAGALDVYIQSHSVDDPLVKYLAQFGSQQNQVDALRQLIKDLLPDESNGGAQGSIGMSDLVFDMILDRLSAGGDFAALENGKTGVAAGDMALGGDGDWAIWGRVGALQAEYTPSAVPGYDANTWGMSVGIDGSVAKDVRVGLAYMYQQAKIDENGVGANANTDITGNGVIGYMAYTPDPYFLNLAVGYSWNSYEAKRFTGIGTNTADYDGTQALARVELGRKFTDGKLDITPSIGLRYNYVSQDAYTETGILALHIDSQDVTSVRGTIGVGAKYNMDLAGGGKLIPEASVRLLNQFADPAGSITGNVVGGGAFTTNTTGRDDLSYGVGAGVTYQANDSLTMSLQYRGEFQSDYSQNAGEFNIRLAF